MQAVDVPFSPDNPNTWNPMLPMSIQENNITSVRRTSEQNQQPPPPQQFSGISIFIGEYFNVDLWIED